jgi:hypothetical protein
LSGGWANKRLHRVGFLDSGGDCPFGFLDPAEIVRAVHLMPAFAHGKATLIGLSIAQPADEEDEEWNFYYVSL